MEIAFYLIALAVLLGLNAFFVLAEFAIVKLRPSRVTELIGQGNRRAKLVADIQSRLDEYLAVCQVGITLASVAMGMVGENATGVIMGTDPAERGAPWRYAVAIGISFLVVSGSHIVLGEQVPKTIAIRQADRMALFCALPLRFFHAVFFAPLWLLSRATGLCLRLLGVRKHDSEDHHSEDELRIILENSQSRGLLSFRRLLFIENVFDLGDLKVRDAMRPRSQVRFLATDLHWADSLQFIRTWRFSRYPLIKNDPEKPIGIIHLKDIFFDRREGDAPPDLLKLVRPYLTCADTASLESVLAEMQRRYIHVALVVNADGKWVGMISMEDIIEEIIGTVRDEFETEEPMSLAEALSPARIILGVEAASMTTAIRTALGRVPAADLPLPHEQVIASVLERERLASTYLGRGLAMPHARLVGINRPTVIIARSEHGVPLDGGERVRLMFILLTPAGQPRVHQRLQARIAQLMDSSEYVDERLRQASSPVEIMEAIRTGEQASLD